MTVHFATKTLQLINHTLEKDQGAAYRIALGRVIPHIGDAYRGADEGFRTHLGASLIGKSCSREIYYGFRWFKKAFFEGRILRLFNRGHLEEARFIALLLASGIQVYQQDAQGNQFRISDFGGHLGGSGDGVGIGIPDVPAGEPCLLEAKTHGSKSFAKLKHGVREAKPEHYTQTVKYMQKMKLNYCLYMAVNKDNDELHLEIIHANETHAVINTEKAKNIIWATEPPEKISQSAGWYECKFCTYKDICHGGSIPAVNCRTCQSSQPLEDGTWWCGYHSKVLAKEDQLKACPNHNSF